MNEYLKIDVTPNVKKCMELLAEAVATLPPGPAKEKAEGALNYMELTLKGQAQPMGGAHCVPNRVVVGSP